MDELCRGNTTHKEIIPQGKGDEFFWANDTWAKYQRYEMSSYLKETQYDLHACLEGDIQLCCLTLKLN